jgi:dipeptidase D
MKKTALESVLQNFYELAKIPRPSHHEERVSQFLYDWALSQGLRAQRDSMGNVIIDKDSSVGHENAPRVILQAHMDMVCVAAPNVTHNSLTDPIQVINDGIYLRADGTSLGADNGIGIALAQYLLKEKSFCHGPLRAIFTVNEEDGMASSAMDSAFLDGSYLINLDWETSGSLCNSCAGGDYFVFTRQPDWQATPTDGTTIRISIQGLLGGHSGLDINKGHANALASVATVLCQLQNNGIGFNLASFSGGQAQNAIPRYAAAKLVIETGKLEAAKQIFNSFCREFETGYGSVEKTAKLELTVLNQSPDQVLSKELSADVAGLLACIPNNVHTMSPFIPGLVESSSNLGVISIDSDAIVFNSFARSSVSYQAYQLATICATIARQFGFTFESRGHIAGWAVNPNSKLTELTCDAYQALTGKTMVVEPVHAGLECGAFAEKNPNLDMISIGPGLYDVHSPAERCCIADVGMMAELLVLILGKLLTEN